MTYEDTCYIESRYDSIYRRWCKCPYCNHWIPAWNVLYRGQGIYTREEEQSNLRAVVRFCRWCRKKVDKLVKMWKDGIALTTDGFHKEGIKMCDEARYRASMELSSKDYETWSDRCKQP